MDAQPQEQPAKFHWQVPTINSDQRRTLRQQFGLSRIAAQVLLNRKLNDPAQVATFLTPDKAPLHDPYLFRDMRRAVARVEQALTAGEGIAVYGDYDVDGISGATLLAEFFDGLGHPVTVVIPDRFIDGYGLNPERVAALAGDGIGLIITADNGTSAHRAVARAAELGVDVIITDHHEVGESMPPAYALLNPHRPDGTYPEKNLCGVGVALKLCHAILMGRGQAEADVLPEVLEPLLDLFALGTVADMAPLKGENRPLVRRGLALLSREARPGVVALKKVAGLAGQPVGAGQVGFHLGPRINAGGRVAEGSQGVRLLRAQDPKIAQQAADYLDEANQQRRAIEADTLEEVFGLLDEGPVADCIVLASPDWHAGVLGIIASRVVERYHRPCLLIALAENGVGKGSGRSVPGLHLFDALAECTDLMLGYGGHMYAAGVTVEAAQVSALAERLAQVVSARMTTDQFRLPLKLDASARVAEVGRPLLDEFERFAPFGMGNPEPVLLLKGVVPLQPQRVGQDHLRMTLCDASAPHVRLPAIGFGCGDWLGDLIKEGQPVDIAGTINLNRWQGRETVQFRIKDACRVAPAATPGERAAHA